MPRKASSKTDSTAHLGFEAKLRLAADKLRNNMDAAEDKHVVPGLIATIALIGHADDVAQASSPASSGDRLSPGKRGGTPHEPAAGTAAPRAHADLPGFCKSAIAAEIAAHGHVLTPGRYVGAEEVEDDGDLFEEKMPRLVAERPAGSPNP